MEAFEGKPKKKAKDPEKVKETPQNEEKIDRTQLLKDLKEKYGIDKLKEVKTALGIKEGILKMNEDDLGKFLKEFEKVVEEQKEDI